MNKQILQEIGLTEGEIKVYLAFLKLGDAKKSELVSESQVSSSKVYEIADKLQKKGLIGYIVKGKIRYFKAMEQKRLLDFFSDKTFKFEEQRKELEKMIPFLETSNQETQAALYEGLKAIKNFYRNLLEELKAGEEYYVIGVNYGENLAGVKEFFENFHRQRVERKIKVKMLVNYDAKDILVKNIRLNSEIRYLPQYLMSNMIILFYKNKAFIFFLAKDSIGLLIENNEIVHGFQAYFNTFWKLAKK